MRNNRHYKGQRGFLLAGLLKKGPMTVQEINDAVLDFSIRLGYLTEEKSERKRKKKRRRREPIKIKNMCDAMVTEGLLRIDSEQKYQLTEMGEAAAKERLDKLKKVSCKIKNKIISVQATTKNTIIINVFLAFLKVFAGLLSGSAGLIADGADAVVDTVSAIFVWLGVKFKKEILGTIVVILMMFFTSITIGFNSANKIIEAFNGNIEAMDFPLLVIIVEGIALFSAFLLSQYQHFVGKRNKNLALISQSVDSKNHIYVSGAVVVGAIFSRFGIHIVDSFIGAGIAIRIFLDGIELFKEVLSSFKGEEIDFSKYNTHLGKQLEGYRISVFRSWIIYSIEYGNTRKKENIVASLEKQFCASELPLIEFFDFGVNLSLDFGNEFDRLIEPLQSDELVQEIDGIYMLTPEGLKYANKMKKKFDKAKAGDF